MALVSPYTNFGGLVGEVLQFGFNDGPQVNKKRIEGWINEAQFMIAREVEAPEFQETEELKLTSGKWKYPLPESLLRVQDIYSPEYARRLRVADLQQFDQFGRGLVNSLFEGPPEYYTLYANELWLFPCPSSSSEFIEIRYIKEPPLLVEETAIPLLNAHYWHLLIQYAVTRAFEAEDDFESAQAHSGRFKQDLDAYASDVQWRIVDRPRVLDGQWGNVTTGMRGIL